MTALASAFTGRTIEVPQAATLTASSLGASRDPSPYSDSDDSSYERLIRFNRRLKKIRKRNKKQQQGELADIIALENSDSPEIAMNSNNKDANESGPI